MSNEPDRMLLTIPEAAAVLGVSERTLRRLLSVAPFTGRTDAIERQTAKGCRRTTMIGAELLRDLQAHQREAFAPAAPDDTLSDSVADKAAFGGEYTGRSGGNGGRFDGMPSNATANEASNSSGELDLPATAYREIITRMQSEIEFLRGALSREQENLQREQTLRAMTAGQAIEQKMPQEATGDTDSLPETPAAVSVPDAPETKRGLLARLFGR